MMLPHRSQVGAVTGARGGGGGSGRVEMTVPQRFDVSVPGAGRGGIGGIPGWRVTVGGMPTLSPLLEARFVNREYIAPPGVSIAALRTYPPCFFSVSGRSSTQ